MHTLSLREWSDHLTTLAALPLAGTPLEATGHPHEAARSFLDTFADEHGDRRATDRPLLARLLGINPGPTPQLDNPQIDLLLWWALHNQSTIEGLVAPAPGPLVGEHAFKTGAIETTTETELAALHALAHHAEKDPTGALFERCRQATRWHIATLQPDNGTNHPWAVHVFLILAAIEKDDAFAVHARLHAETLVHNAMVSMGRPDRFSACLLLDAARSLERHPV